MFDHNTLQVIEDKASHLEQEAKDLIARIIKNIKRHISANPGDPINARIDSATEEAIDKHLEIAPAPVPGSAIDPTLLAPVPGPQAAEPPTHPYPEDLNEVHAKPLSEADSVETGTTKQSEPEQSATTESIPHGTEA